ncbi:MAG: hypothetical protein JWR14_3544 [Caballeronia sp.]|jgi:hypothetical protein|nr:hypothetical protein [Caballeronia sp.]
MSGVFNSFSLAVNHETTFGIMVFELMAWYARRYQKQRKV